jgi:uncharacterized membrane protein
MILLFIIIIFVSKSELHPMKIQQEVIQFRFFVFSVIISVVSIYIYIYIYIYIDIYDSLYVWTTRNRRVPK